MRSLVRVYCRLRCQVLLRKSRIHPRRIDGTCRSLLQVLLPMCPSRVTCYLARVSLHLVAGRAISVQSRPVPVHNSASAFSGFGDDESGFYQTYSKAFQEVWEAEKEWGDVDSSADAGRHHVWGKGEAPEMGGSQDSFETANAFYSAWNGFASGLSFGWVDDYNVNEVRL